MKPVFRTLLLAGFSLALGAGESEPSPFYVQVRVDQPLLALKDQVGNRVGTGGSMGYTFYQRPSRGLFMEVDFRIDGDHFENKSLKTSAEGVGMGPELTMYFNSKPQGFYLNVAYAYQHWALTAAGTEDARTRLAGAIGLGYRFEKGFSLEARYHGVQVDERTRIGSLALGFGARF